MLTLYVVLYCVALFIAWLTGLKLIEYSPYVIGSSYVGSILLGGLIERCIAERADRSLPDSMGRAFQTGLVYFLPSIAARASVFWIAGLLFVVLMARLVWLRTRYGRPVRQ